MRTFRREWPVYGWIGVFLIAVCWPLNWMLDGLRTHWGFFPLWLGYILTVEAIVHFRTGSSMIRVHPRRFVWLFFWSMPAWWLFEGLNERAEYWIYTPIESFSDIEYYAYCTLNFSTVLPAVFSTTEWMCTFSWLQRLGKGPVVGRRPRTAGIFFFTGWIMLAAFLIWPQYGWAFMWMSVFFILDPVNHWLGYPSLLDRTARGDWRPVIALWLGCLLCGFFWECWNYYSSPRWIYDVPNVNFWHVFEMPLLGYLGYLPFALELYALYMLLTGLFKQERMEPFSFL